MSDIWQLTVLCNLVYRTFYWTCPINHGVDFERKAGSGHGSGHQCPDNVSNINYILFYQTPDNKDVIKDGDDGGIKSGHGSGHEITYDCPDRVKGIDKRVYLDKMIIVSKITDNLTVMSDKKIKLVMIQ